MKSLLKNLMPKTIIRMVRRTKQRVQDSRNASRSVKDVFSEIYRDGHWGKRDDRGFCSGSGSVNPSITTPYIEMIVNYLKDTDHKKIIVDLGCGDMKIGQHFLDSCAQYIGVDVVPELIEQHKSTYKGRNEPPPVKRTLLIRDHSLSKECPHGNETQALQNLSRSV